MRILSLLSSTNSAMNKISNKFFLKEEGFAIIFQLQEILLELHKGIIHRTGFEASPIHQPISKSDGRATEEEEPRTITVVLTRPHTSHELLTTEQAKQSKTQKHTACTENFILDLQKAELAQ